MKKCLFALLCAALLLIAACSLAENSAAPIATPAPAATSAPAAAAAPGVVAPTTEYRWFVSQYGTVRGRTVTYYDNVYAVNHGKYGLTPFAGVVPAEYFVVDEGGAYAVAPIVLDIADAMRIRLYGGDMGETALLYGQYCDRIRGTADRVGFSGIHEGIDFVAKPGATLHAILDGVVTRAGDSNGTVGVYSADYDVTLLYLHCEKICVRRGDEIEAGAAIGVEGDKKAGAPYTHVEMRKGRHTSSSPYRDTQITSDCPYAVMQTALSVAASGREPVTFAAAEALRKQQAEEEAKRLEAEKLAEQAAPAVEATPEVELVDVLPATTEAGYGFGGETPAANATPAPSAADPAPEATLPPANP